MASDYNILAVDHAIRKVGLTLVPYSETFFGYAPANYRETVLADRPIGYWRLGDLTGQTAVDSSSYSHDGTYVALDGTFTLGVGGALTGDPDAAVLFAPRAWMQVPQPSDLPFEFAGTLPFSLECWFKATATPAAAKSLVNKATYGLFWDNVGVGFSRGHALNDSVVATPGTWVHLVGTYDGATMRLYRNGSLVSSIADAASQTATAAALFSVARHVNSLGISQIGEEANATIDEVAVYDYALSATRVTAHHTAGTTAGRIFPLDRPIVARPDMPIGNAVHLGPSPFVDLSLLPHRYSVAGRRDTGGTLVVGGSFTMVVELLNSEPLLMWADTGDQTFAGVGGTSGFAGPHVGAVQLPATFDGYSYLYTPGNGGDAAYIRATAAGQRDLFLPQRPKVNIGPIRSLALLVTAKSESGIGTITDSWRFGTIVDGTSTLQVTTGTYDLVGVLEQFLNPGSQRPWSFDDLSFGLEVGVKVVTLSGVIRVNGLTLFVNSVNHDAECRVWRQGPTVSPPAAPASTDVPIYVGPVGVFSETQPTLPPTGQYYWYTTRIYDLTGRERALVGPVGVRQV